MLFVLLVLFCVPAVFSSLTSLCYSIDSFFSFLYADFIQDVFPFNFLVNRRPPVPNHHCDCGELLILNQVTCREVSEIPENLPNSTQVLDDGQGFIGSILDQRQVTNLSFFLSFNHPLFTFADITDIQLYNLCTLR